MIYIAMLDMHNKPTWSSYCLITTTELCKEVLRAFDRKVANCDVSNVWTQGSRACAEKPPCDMSCCVLF